MENFMEIFKMAEEEINYPNLRRNQQSLRILPTGKQ